VAAMQQHDVAALLLLGQSNVVYATGLKVPAAEMNQSLHRRAVTLVTADGAAPHLWTWYPEGIPTELPADHVHAGLRLEYREGGRALAAVVDEVVGADRLAVDELTMPLRAALGDRELVDASMVLGPAKLQKTADEIECIRRAQRINEVAIDHVKQMVAPGV